MTDSDILKGIKNIAKFIGESERTTWQRIKDRALPAFRHSERGRWLMKKSDYEAQLRKVA